MTTCDVGTEVKCDAAALVAGVRARRVAVGDLPASQVVPVLAGAVGVWVEVQRWLVALVLQVGPGGWRAAGAVDAAGWLRARGVPGRDAKELATAARAIGSVAVVRDAFERGAVTVAQAAVLGRLADLVVDGRCDAGELDPVLVAAAGGERPEVLRDRCRAIELRVRGPKARQEVARVTEFTTDDGMGVLHAELAAEDQRVVVRAIDRLVDEKWRAGHDADSAPATRELPELRAGALLELAQRSLRGEAGTGGAGRSTAEVIVIVDDETFISGELAPTSVCRLADGTPIPADAARRIASEAGIRPAVRRDGHVRRLGRRIPVGFDDRGVPHTRGRPLATAAQLVAELRDVPLDHGRRRRLASWEQRLALLVRTLTCEHPQCSIPAAWCRAHHRVGWTRRGPTDLANLELICHTHHGHHHADERRDRDRRGPRRTRRTRGTR